MMDLYGVSDHGGGPTRAMLDEGFHWAGPGHVMPKYEFGTAQSFFSTIESKSLLTARSGTTIDRQRIYTSTGC